MSRDTKPLITAAIAQSGAATTEVVAAVAGKRIKVVSYQITIASAGSAQWKSATTALSGAMVMPTNGALTMTGTAHDPVLETAAGEALNLVSTTAAVTGFVRYCVE